MTAVPESDSGLNGRADSRWVLVRRVLVVIVAFALVVVVSRWLDHYLILDDDTERGQSYRHYLERNSSFPLGTADFCRSAAEEFYGEPILDPPNHGNPTPAEKAFFVGCSGVTVGGHGGGQGD